jgi:hypothetical protein
MRAGKTPVRADAAVFDAQRAMRDRKLGADYALRQSLVDLAAISELVAEDLPAPTSNPLVRHLRGLRCAFLFFGPGQHTVRSRTLASGPLSLGR